VTEFFDEARPLPHQPQPRQPLFKSHLTCQPRLAHRFQSSPSPSPSPPICGYEKNQCLYFQYFQLSTLYLSFMQPMFSQPQALPFHLRINTTQAQVTFRAGFRFHRLSRAATSFPKARRHSHPNSGHINTTSPSPSPHAAFRNNTDVTLQILKKHHALSLPCR
jgi:hypothetical protein